MAGINYQYELIKMYLAAFIRPPEKSGLEYWLLQLNNGKSFDNVLETVFSLDIVKDIYPTNLPNESFITLIYVNVFGKSPDLQGLAYWKQQLVDGRSRGNVVMDMINAGLSTPDGTPGKAYIVNRMSVAQFAIDQQFAQKADLSPAYLKTVMLGVNANPDTITSANKLLGSASTGIGLGAPINSLSVTAAADGISAAEAAAGVTVVVDLLGTNAAASNIVELLMDGRSFPTAITKQLSAADITAKKVSLFIPNTTNWGADGIKLLQVTLKNNLGSSSPPGGDLRVDLNIVAPKAPDYSLFVPASEDGINSLEKAAGVSVQVFVAETGAVAGDKLEILLNGQSFNPKVMITLTANDIDFGVAEVIIPGTANWGIDGEKLLAARVVDKAGNVGGSGGGVGVILDTIAPNPPTNAIKISAATDGLSNAERALPVAVFVDLTGTNAQVGDSVELLIDNKPFGSSTVHTLTVDDISANSITLYVAAYDPAWTIVEGTHSVSARMIDTSGNVSKGGGNLSVLVDSVAPNTEITTFTIAAAKDGISAAEIAAGVQVTVNLLGSGVVAGDIVNVLIGAPDNLILYSQAITAAQVTAKLINLTIPSSANWGEDGHKLISVSFTDVTGNTSAASPATVVVLDTTAPLPSTEDLIVPVSLNGINIVEKSEGVLVKFDLSGTQAQVKDKVEILLNGTAFATPVLYSLTADDIANKFASVVVPGNAVWGADGEKYLSARVIDAAGNVGSANSPMAVLIDTTPPIGPVTPLIVPANEDGGISIIDRNQGVVVKASLAGTNIQIGDRAELLIGGLGFATPVTHIVTDADMLAQEVSFNIGPNDGWGADGVKSLAVRFIDFAGNIGLPSGSKSITLDGVAPNPTSAILSIAAAQNGINLQEKMSGFDAIIDLNGTGAVSGDVINLYIDGVPFSTPIKHTITAAQALAKSATVKVPANSDWLGDGNHVISVVIVDAAGNVGSAGGILLVQVDTTAPGSGTNPVVIPAAMNGINNLEKNTGVAVEVNLAGTNALVSDQLELLINGISFATPIVQTLSSADLASGLINLLIPSSANWGADGAKNISFRVTDVAGNRGSISVGLAVNLDTSAPVGPTNSLVVPANSSGGISLTELNAGVDVIVNLTGTSVVAGDSVEILIGGNAFATPVLHVLTPAEISAKSATLTIAGTSIWGADGAKNLTARFIDIAGNVGTASGLSTVNVDTSGINSTMTPLVVNAAANGINFVEKNAGVDVVVDLNGTGVVSGDQIQILIDGAPFSTAAIFTITAAQVLAKTATVKIPGTADWMSDGNHVLPASLIDKAGNVGSPAGDLIVLLDTTVPNPPLTQLDIPAASSGLNNAERLAGTTVLVSLNGTGVVAGDRVELLIDGKTFSTTISQILSASDISNGQVSLTIGPTANWGADGAKNISARFIDVAGNVGVAGGNFIVTLDTTAPAGPASALVVPANSGGGITTTELNAGVDVIVNLTGTKAVAGETVEILIGGNSFATPVSHVLTAAEITAKTVTLTIGIGDGWGGDGVKALTARYIDSAGNVGTATGLTNVVLDGLAPNPISQAMVVAAAVNGISNAERAAGVNVVVDLTGTGALAGDTITLFLDGMPFSTPVTQKITASQITAKSATIMIPGTAVWGADGSKTLTATITDSTSNTSLPGGDTIIVLDTIAPNPPVNAVDIAVALNGISAAEKTSGVAVIVDLSGSGASAGDKVELVIGGLAFATPVVKTLTVADIASGLVSLTIPSAAGWGVDGNKSISARLTDVAGNVGSSGGTSVVVLDTVAPAGPTSTLNVVANSGGGITVAEKNAGVDVVVNLNGTTVVAGDVVEVLIGGLPFSNPVKHVLTAAEILAKSATLTIGGTDGWGADGSKVLTARFTDIAGNVGNGTGSLTVTLDTGAPNPPSSPLVVSVATNGINSAEKLAGVSVVVSLLGTGAVAGDTIHLQVDTSEFSVPVTQVITAAQIVAKSATVIIPGSAVWGVDGNKLLTATIVDALGNTGAPGGDLTVLLDTTPPTSPVNPLVSAVTANGLSLSEKNAGVSVVVDLTGTSLVAGDSVELLLSGFPFATPILKLLTASDISNGNTSILIPASANWGVDGTKTISMRGIDLSGNMASGGGALSFQLDTVAPTGPINPLNIAANLGGGITAIEKNAGVVVDVDLTGTSLVAGDKVEILIGGISFATAVIHTLSASEVGTNLASVTIGASDGWGADGTKSLSARMIDIAGNIGFGSGTTTVTLLDTTAPNPPNAAMVVAAASNGINLSEKNAGVAVTVNLSGTGAVAGDLATLLIDGANFSSPVTHTITAGEVTGASFSFLINGTDGWGLDGNKVLTATLTDVAGNTSAGGGAVSVLLDTSAPSAPTNPMNVAAAAFGINSTEKAAGVTAIIDLTGTSAVAGDSVEMLLDGAAFSVPVLYVLTSADILAGNASVVINNAAGWGADGAKTLSARILDIAGNIGLAGGSLITSLETTIPSASAPTYTDADVDGTMSAGDTFLFTISEATNKLIGISEILLNNSHQLGTGATAIWDGSGTQLTVTLGTGVTLVSGDTITLVGVSDLAGNSTDLSFSI